jgi:acetyl esterase/lipase
MAIEKLDIAVPDGDGPFPAVVFVHGGGWQFGDKSNCPSVKVLGKQDYVLASINYRLIPAVYPAQIEDCKAAIRWLRAHAATYHIDGNRIGVWGSSAGGHLVALLGTTNNLKTYDVGENLNFSSKVQAVCDFFGPADFTGTDGQVVQEGAAEQVIKLLGGSSPNFRELAREASPITYVDKSNPPFLIVHGMKDPIVPEAQSEALFEALHKAGVPVELVSLPEAGHGGPAFSKLEVQQKVRDFFAKYLEVSSPKT